MSGTRQIIRLLIFTFLLHLASADATTVAPDECREVAGPEVIAEPGCIRVIADISATDPGQSAIVIHANGVSVDLGGHTLRGAGAGSTSAGIHVLGADDFLVRNGRIDGFLYGIRAEPQGNETINSVTVERVVVGTGTARGIFVQAERADLRDNIVKNLTGYTGWPGANTVGIDVVATSCRIAGNVIAELYPEGAGAAIGISLSEAAKDCEVVDNVLSNSKQPESGRAIAFSLGADVEGLGSRGLRIAQNSVSGFAFAAMASPAILASLNDNRFGADCTTKAAHQSSATDANLILARSLACPDTDASAGADDDESERACRNIDSPTVITRPGCFRVTSDIAATEPGQSAIVVNADRVSIDLGGHTLRGSGPASTSAGVHVLGADDFSIQNGTIAGFLYGIRAEPYADNKINRVDVERIVIAEGSARGIFVQADRAVLRNNIVRNLNGYSDWPGSYTFGIEVVVANCDITGNVLADIYPEGVGEAVGISITEAVKHCTVADNVIANSKRPEFGRAIAFWVSADQWRQDRKALRLTRNQVYGYSYAFMAPPESSLIDANSFGVDCTPDDVDTYGSAAATNRFGAKGWACRDKPKTLAVLARDGNPNWRIRLAASYIEQAWHWKKEKRTLKNVCRYYRSAEKILAPLVQANNVAAADQMKRLPPLIANCR